MSTSTSNPQTETAEQFAERVIQSVSTMLDVFGIYAGDQLGLYQVLAQDGPLSARQLAARTGTNERYIREWLEHQAVAGVLDVETVDSEPPQFSLSPERAEVLADVDSLNYIAPLVQTAVGAVAPKDKLLTAFRNGNGIGFHEYGRDLREGQGRLNRAAFLQLLGSEWIPAMRDVHQLLTSADQPRVADFGCGVGWSSIGTALAYPNAEVEGFDTDEASIAAARGNAIEYGVEDRVRFWVRDAGDPELHGRYDLVIALECIHDMSDPVSALRTMRRLVRDQGAVFVVDERVGDEFNPNAGLIEKLMYGFSVTHCLPSGMADEPSAATGTVMRRATFRRYAEEAGYRDVQELPMEYPLFRFYRLVV